MNAANKPTVHHVKHLGPSELDQLDMWPGDILAVFDYAWGDHGRSYWLVEGEPELCLLPPRPAVRIRPLGPPLG